MSYTLLDNRDKDLINQDINKVSEQYNIKNKFGSSIVANDSADFSLMNLKLYGKTTQITTTGKNLAPVSSLSYVTYDEQTGTINSITTNNTVEQWVKIMLFKDSTNVKTAWYGYDDNTLGLKVVELTKDDTFNLITVGFNGNNQDSHIFLDCSSLIDGETYKVVFNVNSLSNNASVISGIMIVDESIIDYNFELFCGGQPSPSPQYEQPLESVGKLGNLLEVIATSQTISGITFTINTDKSITVNGTAQYRADLIIGNITYKANKTYIMSGISEGGSDKWALWTKGGGTLYSGKKEFTITEDTETHVSITIFEGATVNNLTFYPQITYAEDNITSYRPYNGQKEIENRVCGGNLFDNYIEKVSSNRTSVTYDKATDEYVFVCTGTDMYLGLAQSKGSKYKEAAGNLIKIDNNKKYFFKVSNPLFAKVFVCCYDENLISLGFNAVSTSEVVIIKNAKYMTFRIGMLEPIVGTTYRTKIMVSTEDIDFEPYTKQSHISLVGDGLKGIPVTDASLATYTDENGQMWCSDYVDCDRGVLVQRIQSVILDGSQSNYYLKNDDIKNNYMYYYYPDGKAKKAKTNDVSKYHLICNKLIVKTVPIINSDNNIESVGCASSNNGAIYINIGYFMEENTIEEFKRVLSENPLTVQYILATPIETPLSASEIASFKALHSNYKVTSVMNDCDAEMEIKYAGDAYESGLSDVIDKSIDNKVGDIDSKVLINGADYGIERIQIEETDGQLQLVFRAADGTRKGAINFDLADTTTE